MKKTSKLIAVLLAFVLMLTLAASCGNDEPGTDPAPSTSPATSSASPPAPASSPAAPVAEVPAVPAPTGVNLAEHIDMIVDSIALTLVNPLIPSAFGTAASWCYVLVHDRLITRRPGSPSDFDPALAIEWHTDDFQTWTFKLRDDVTWHNGDHFTAEDVVWTYSFAKENVSAPTNSTWMHMESITALEPYLLEIVLLRPNIDFLFEISGNFQGILNGRVYDSQPDDPTWGHVGTGPFMISEFSPNDYATLERFDSFWGERPPTKSMTFLTVPEMSTRMSMLANAEAQISFQMTVEDLDSLVDSDEFQILSVYNNEPITLGYNDMGDEIVTDINFRLAIAYALNLDDITLVSSGNWASAAWDGSVWGPFTEYRLEGLPRWEQNLDLAKEYLSQSVYNGEVIELMTTPGANATAAEMIQLQLEQIGIKIDVKVLDMAGFLAEHRFDPESTRQLHIFAQGMSPNVTLALNALTSRSLSRQNMNDPHMLELADSYRATPDSEGRRQIAYEIQEYFLETLPTMALFWRISAIAAVNGIGGVALNTEAFEHNLRGIYWNLDETPANLRP